MCEFLSFAVHKPTGDLYVNLLDSHSGIEAAHGLEPDSYREAEWEFGKDLTVRVANGEDENWFKSAVLCHYDCMEHIVCDIYNTVLAPHDRPKWLHATAEGALIEAIKAGDTAAAQRLVNDGATISGWLDLYGCESLTTLPDGLSVGDWLDLYGCESLTALPDGLSVGGGLDLRGTWITALPDGLTVGGYLDLEGTDITALPDGLSVGGCLDLSRTGITEIPADAKIDGEIYGLEKSK